MSTVARFVVRESTFVSTVSILPSISVVSTSILSTTVSTVARFVVRESTFASTVSTFVSTAEIAETIAARGSSSTKVAVGEFTSGEEVSFKSEV